MAHISYAALKQNIPNPPKDNPNLHLPALNRHHKQKDFVLNCDSSEWKLPQYNSLYDRHLTSYFINPKVRNVLLKTGVVDDAGNIAKEKTRDASFFQTNKMQLARKLPPIPEDQNLAIQRLQRIILPYRNKSNKENLDKLVKNKSMPTKRTNTQENVAAQPRKTYLLPTQARVSSYIRKVKPLSKEELDEVFAKYRVKAVKPSTNPGVTEPTLADQHTADSSLQDIKASEAVKRNPSLDESSAEADVKNCEHLISEFDEGKPKSSRKSSQVVKIEEPGIEFGDAMLKPKSPKSEVEKEEGQGEEFGDAKLKSPSNKLEAEEDQEDENIPDEKDANNEQEEPQKLEERKEVNQVDENDRILESEKLVEEERLEENVEKPYVSLHEISSDKSVEASKVNEKKETVVGGDQGYEYEEAYVEEDE